MAAGARRFRNDATVAALVTCLTREENMRRATMLAALAAALAASSAGAQGCPPGLAKKSPACVPPGLAKKQAPEWRGDDVLRGNYVIVRDRARYRLPPLGPGEQYYRMGDRILRVDDGTKQILDIIALGAGFLD
jgi:hypothetical protein